MIGRSNAVGGGSELSPQKITNNTSVGMDVPSEALPGEFVDIKPFAPLTGLIIRTTLANKDVPWNKTGSIINPTYTFVMPGGTVILEIQAN